MWASAEGGAPEVTLETSMGAFTIELYYKHAPRTCRNFIELSRRGYYDNVKFHRIIKDFIVQGGDPTGTGRGGESIYGAKFEDEIRSELKHTGAGILSMANAGPDSNGSQFFITLAPCASLDGKHTIFGRVCRGMEVIKRLGSVQTDNNDRFVGNMVFYPEFVGNMVFYPEQSNQIRSREETDRLNMGDCSEDWCFHCKDGGTLRLCDHEGCDKAYHPKCVGRKNSFLKTKKPWTCSKHSCHVCRKNKSTTAAAIGFSCLCCPYALCEPCYEESIASNAPEFSLLRGKDNKSGLCNVCLEKIRLVEANSEEGPDGEQPDLDEQEYSLLKGYWEIIKEKEGSSLDDVYSPNAAKRKRSDPLLQFCNYMKPEARKLRASAGLRETKIKSDECWKFKDSDSC